MGIQLGVGLRNFRLTIVFDHQSDHSFLDEP